MAVTDSKTRALFDNREVTMLRYLARTDMVSFSVSKRQGSNFRRTFSPFGCGVAGIAYIEAQASSISPLQDGAGISPD
jgi:hypothetical protein